MLTIEMVVVKFHHGMVSGFIQGKTCADFIRTHINNLAGGMEM